MEEDPENYALSDSDDSENFLPYECDPEFKSKEELEQDRNSTYRCAI